MTDGVDKVSKAEAALAKVEFVIVEERLGLASSEYLFSRKAAKW
jgi:hypothetical protein